MPEPKSVKGEPLQLQPYLFHKVSLSTDGADKNAPAENCPFCDTGGGKFTVNKENGMYGCRKCGETGNSYTFMRRLHEISVAPESELAVVAEERGIGIETLKFWGLVKSAIDGEWMLPNYGWPKPGKKADINNLFRWVRMPQKNGTFKRRLLSTATMPRYPFGMQFYDPQKPDIALTEGAWGGMKLWEVFHKVRQEGEDFIRTVDITKSLYTRYNVLGGLGAESFKEGWEKPFEGKNAILLYDNDHPRVNKKTQQLSPPAGFHGVKKAVKMVRGVAKSVRVLLWGEEGYDPTLEDGYDVRDLLIERT